ncbi:SMI1/KNR4 family protein [Priestia megaterium]|uniref:SMI1/KNR4 family protein n=1 Tax=Priestia megaterium TaxID=1404 RepID=UPI003CAD07F2
MNIEIKNNSKPANLQEIQSFEEEWNIELPDDYKEFLLKTNGGNPIIRRFQTLDKKITSSLTSILPFTKEVHKNVQNVFLAFHNNHIIPDNFLIIGEDPIDNKICLSLSGEDAGAVYYWSLDMEDIYEEEYEPSNTHFSLISYSFEDFIKSLKDK